MSQYKLSANSNSVLNSGLTTDYKQAIAEYIWNGFDAGASTIYLTYEAQDDFGILKSFTISDNGRGIKKDTLELTFGHFLDSQKKRSFQRTSDVHGKQGKGRFSFHILSERVEWETRYINDAGDLMQYTISINKNDLSKYNTTEEVKLDKSKFSTGTIVRFIEISGIKKDYIEDVSFSDYINRQFAWFLCLNSGRDFTIKLNGIGLSYEDLIAVNQTNSIDIDNEHFKLTYIRWKCKVNEKCYFYMMNSKLLENFKILTSFNNNTIDFYHSVFVQSSYFDDFYFEITPESRLDGCPNQSDSVYKHLIKKLKTFLNEKEKTFVNEIAANKLIDEYELKGVLPHFKDNAYDQMRKDDLKQSIKEIYSIQPKIFKGLRIEQQKTFVAFLNLLLDSEERDKILFILDGIVSLTEEERQSLANVLKSTSMSKISKVANMMHNRLEAIECLKTLVYDLTKFTTERDHIQKIVEKCFWLFGEQYHLVSADETFEKALTNYTYILDGIPEKTITKINNSEHNRRPDIFMCRKRTVGDATSLSMLEENIIVELKRPSVNIGKTQYRQIEDYLDLISSEPQFNSESRIWKFIVVSKILEDDVKAKYESFKHLNKRYLIYQQKRFEIYAMSWDDIFKEFEYRHQYILEKLSFNKATIKEEVEQVKKDVESANSLTQKILSLDIL